MKDLKTLPGWLIVFEDDQDAEKIDPLLKIGTLKWTKLGNKIYLGHYEQSRESIHTVLKQKTGIVGKIYWFSLGLAEVTDGIKEVF